MPSLFAGPPKPSAIPKPKTVPNTALNADQAAAGRRQGMQAALLSGAGGRTGTMLTHTLTGQ